MRGVPQLVQKLAVGDSGCPHDRQKLEPKAGVGIGCAWIIACRCLSFLATATATTMAISIGGMSQENHSCRLQDFASIHPPSLIVCHVVAGIPLGTGKRNRFVAAGSRV